MNLKVTRDAIEGVVSILNEMKPHEIGDHIVAWGEYPNGTTAPQTIVFNKDVGPYTEQARQYGVMLKNMSVRAEVVVLVKNGTIPDLKLKPVCVVLAMTRGGDYEQVVYDCKERKIISSSSNMRDTDQMVCSSVFYGQAIYKPEIERSIGLN